MTGDEHDDEGAGHIPSDVALAVEALDELRNSHAQGQRDTLLDKVRANSLINNAVRVYEHSKSQYPSFRKGAEMMERKAIIPMVKRIEETSIKWKSRRKRTRDEDSDGSVLSEEESESSTESKNDRDQEHSESSDEENEEEDSTMLEERTFKGRISKRQKISRAFAKSKNNFKEYKLNMSIESKKRLITCLHLLKLANNQLSNRVSFLQDLVQKEQQLRKRRIKVNEKDSDHDEFYDASDNIDEQSTVIKMEVVGTVKKVYALISKFTGNSLPEPARTQVRESLLKLPMNWTTMINSEDLAKRTNSKIISPNGKVLLLARESLDMVHNVMGVVDNTLGKAEEWVKHKQEIKEMLKEQYRNAQLREKVKNQMVKEGDI
ncbi:LAFE_0H15060g1_1 [Lachancea fermentati]|uniref:LAFE_0H15060g1_1 n=1 Tax=Lachancea fermentati TaxID=4955 RepID=A0A1G4MKU0_LACFM|nr:LAFE_0H15060g1_1 [Lachancea fermentati]